MKKVIYTILFGDYILHEPTYLNNDWELICFSDMVIKSDNWNVVNVKYDDPIKKSREIKIRCDRFIDFDICIYIDAKFTIKCDLNKFVYNNLKFNMSLMKHNRRNCLYKEAKYCLDIGKGKKEDIIKQINYYKQLGFPKNFGLYAPGIMIRKNNHDILKFMKLWYDEVKKYSCRDQISFPYVLWKNPIKFDIMPFKKTYGEFK